MGLSLKCPTLSDVEKARQWRNELMEIHRTPFMLTKEMQEKFYHEVICNRNANSRWWSLWGLDGLIGFTGLVNIEWENGSGEVTLILSPGSRGKGNGEAALRLLFDEGFGNLGLSTIHGECYECNSSRLGFWEHMVEKFNGYKTTLPRRKRWQGQLYDSMYFAFWR